MADGRLGSEARWGPLGEASRAALGLHAGVNASRLASCLCSESSGPPLPFPSVGH